MNHSQKAIKTGERRLGQRREWHQSTGRVYIPAVADSGEPGERADRPFMGDTASFYARYRREYPAELISRLREFNRGGRGRLLDLGCGTGQLLLQLVGSFAH